MCLFLLEKKDLAKHLGKSYLFEPVRYGGTPQMITALANGELEIDAFSTLPIAIQNAGVRRNSRALASGINNSVASVATLLAIAIFGAVGLSGFSRALDQHLRE
jgi:hypothetical protein